jgi:hypothetical protein
MSVPLQFGRLYYARNLDFISDAEHINFILIIAAPRPRFSWQLRRREIGIAAHARRNPNTCFVI